MTQRLTDIRRAQLDQLLSGGTNMAGGGDPRKRAMYPKMSTQAIVESPGFDPEVPSDLSRAYARRMAEKDAYQRSMADQKLTPSQRAVAGLETAGMLGSAMFEGIRQLPKLMDGEDAYINAVGEHMYQPRFQPEKAAEYAGNVTDFLERLETEYKMPQVMPELLPFVGLSEAAKQQAKKAAKQGALTAVSRMGTGPRAGSMAAQRGAVKMPGGNWVDTEVKHNLNKLKQDDSYPQSAIESAKQDLEAVKRDAGTRMDLGEQNTMLETAAQLQRDIDHMEHTNAFNKWVDTKVGGYVRNQMATPDDRVIKMLDERAAKIESDYQAGQKRLAKLDDRIAQAEASASTQEERNNLVNLKRTRSQRAAEIKSDYELAMDTMLPGGKNHSGYDFLLNDAATLINQREKAGFPIAGYAQSEPAKAWEATADFSALRNPASKFQGQAEKIAASKAAAMEYDQYVNIELPDKFNAYLETLLNLSLSDKQKQALRQSTPKTRMADIIGERERLIDLAKARNAAESEVDVAAYGMAEDNPYIAKLPPETSVYNAIGLYDFGIDHIIDVLKDDIATGKIKLEDLNKITMDQAVKRAAEYDFEMAKKSRDAIAKSRASMPVHKEYPEGYKWVQLTKPGEFNAESNAMGHSVRGYEPERGHPDWTPESGDSGSEYYGHGGWEAIKSGKAKVYSLVDPSGKPHATIEVMANPKPYPVSGEEFAMLPSETKAKYGQYVREWRQRNPDVEELTDEHTAQALKEAGVPPQPDYITQIKGKGNARPQEKYDPYTQDFVKSGNWKNVRDLRNTGLIEHSGKYFTEPEFVEAVKKYGRMGVQDIPWDVARQRHIEAGISEEEALENWVEAFKEGRGTLNIPDEPHMSGGGLLSKLSKASKATRKIETAGTKYATQQEGPFFRVQPTTLGKDAATTRGTKEEDGLRATSAVAGGTEPTRRKVPQLLSSEEVGRIIADPIANQPLNIAKKYTQDTQGVEFGVPKTPSSSLAKQSGIARTFNLAVQGSPEYKSAIFGAYSREMPDLMEQIGAKNYDDLLEKAYRQMAKETDDQFKRLPYNFSYHRAGEGNYNGAKDMAADVHGNRHLYVYQGGDKHDFLHNVDPQTGLNENEKFRAVHDLLGHAIYGNEFGPKGEEMAWAVHQQMYSPLARIAMTAETRGQNSVVNYSPLNAKLKKIIAEYEGMSYEARRRGDKALVKEIEDLKRQAYSGLQFAPNKAVLLPPEFMNPQFAGGMPSYLKAANLPIKGTETRSVLTHYSNEPNLQFIDPTKYGTGIKGAEAERLRNLEGGVQDRSYFYLGEPGTVVPEAGLGSNRYRGESSSLYDITQDPLDFRLLAREANRTPFTARANAGFTYPMQEANDYERLVKEYGYEGMINPNATKPMGIMFEPTKVEPHMAGGGLLSKLGKAAKAARAAEELVPAAGRMKFADKPRGGLNIIKETGGNWLGGSVENVVKPLKSQGASEADKAWFEQRREQNPEEYRRAMETIPRTEAINQWIDRNLVNYIKKQMATSEDPIRKLAEQGITHMPKDALERGEWLSEQMEEIRRMEGFPGAGVAQTEMGRGWENLADEAISITSPSGVGKQGREENPWLSKLDPNQSIYRARSIDMKNLGFDHIVDVLKQDLAEGRIRPEQLSKVSIEQAVRRAHEYDQEMAKKMREAAIKQTEGMPVHKEYPEGYKWIELKAPNYNALPLDERKAIIAKLTEEAKQKGLIPEDYIEKYPESQLAEALKYEGDTMGHCVGGYCPDVVSGRSRIFSLRDAKGEPHVTVETQPAEMRGGQSADEWLATPHRIIQIKGKQNRAPKEEYLPFVQDFVRSGNWSDVGDFRNTGLIRKSDLIDKFSPEQLDAIGSGEYLNKAEYDDLLLKALRPPEEGMASGGSVGLKNALNNLLRTDKPEAHMSGGGAMLETALKAAKAAKIEHPLVFPRAAAKSLEDIRPIAQRVAEQMTGEFVRQHPNRKVTTNPANKSRKQFEREQNIPMETRNLVPPADVPTLDYETKMGNILLGVPGDPTLGGVLEAGSLENIAKPTVELTRVGDVTLEHPVPLFGGPRYGDKNRFWASNYGAAVPIQNRADKLSEMYESPVLGQYIKMAPDSANFALHNLDALLAIQQPEKLPKGKMQALNKVIKDGSPKYGKFPGFAGFEDPAEVLLQSQLNSNLRKHIAETLTKPTITDELGLPNGLDVVAAITYPELRNMESGISGFSIGELRPKSNLKMSLSEHPTYDTNIPGALIGQSKYPVPSEIAFPDTTAYARSRMTPGVQEFNMLKMLGPRERIDQQYIDEIKMYEELMKKYTGKKKGGLAQSSKSKKVARNGNTVPY